jgi:hypothetical protein
MIQVGYTVYLLLLITIIFKCLQVIIPKAIVSICISDHDMPIFQYDNANVLLQMMLKTPAVVSR